MITATMYKLSVYTVIAISFIAFLGVFSPVLAQGDPTSFSQGLDSIKSVAQENKLGEARSTKEILQSLVKWLLSLVGTIAVISLVYGGFLYITSQGEENKAEQAKQLILYSVIGLIIIGLSAVIVNVVISVTQ